MNCGRVCRSTKPAYRFLNFPAFINTTSLFVGILLSLALVQGVFGTSAEWELVSPTDPEGDGNPEPVHITQAAYDTVRQVFVIHGGKRASDGMRSPDLWEFDGVSWEKFTQSIALESLNLVWDSMNSQVLVAFGSDIGAPTFKVRTWDGAVLTDLAIADPEGDGNPGLVTGIRSVFDENAGRLTSHGGQIFGTVQSKTWEWTGASWDEIVPTDPEGDGNPGQRFHQQMVFDPSSGATYLFSGLDGASAVMEETGAVWAWNGISWAMITPTDPEGDGNPVGRARGSFVYHPDLQKSLLIGGDDASSTYLNEIWAWDGTSWENIPILDDLSDGDPSVALGATAYMGNISSVVHFGGNYDAVGTTWKMTLMHEVASITRGNVSPTNLASVDFLISFSDPVTGVDASDFSLVASGVTGASVSGVAGSGDTYVVTVNTGSGDGTLRLDLLDDDSIINGLNVPLGGTGIGNGDFMAGETYAVDKTTASLPVASTYSTLALCLLLIMLFVWSVQRQNA